MKNQEVKISRKLFSIIGLLLLIGVSSCSDSDSPIQNSIPGEFEVTIKDLTAFTAIVEWSEATDSDGDTISYSLNKISGFRGFELIDTLSETSLLLYRLSGDDTYTGEIVANDGKGGQTKSSFEFTTSPGNWCPYYADNTFQTESTTNTITVRWTTAVDFDGDEVYYILQLDDVSIDTLQNTTESTITGLTSMTNYKVTLWTIDQLWFDSGQLGCGNVSTQVTTQ